MGLRDILFGRSAPQAPPTTQPEPRSRWEIMAEQGRRTGRAARDLTAVLGGRPVTGQTVCSYGHPVPPGSTTCAHGHWVG